MLTKQQATHTSRIQKPRRADANAFFNAVRSIDIVDWLATNPSECASMEGMAQAIADICEDVLTQYSHVDTRLNDHFWCDVLVALATGIAAVRSKIEEVPQDIALLATDLLIATTRDAIQQQRSYDRGYAPCQQQKTRKIETRAEIDAEAGLSVGIVEMIIERLVAYLLSEIIAIAIEPLDSIILQLRVLAVLICPDPYAHRVVWNECFLPQLKEEIVIQLQRYDGDFSSMFMHQWSTYSSNDDNS